MHGVRISYTDSEMPVERLKRIIWGVCGVVWYKACKRCGGDLYLEKDNFGSSILCFQCGANFADFETEISEDVIAETIARVETSVASVNR